MKIQGSDENFGKAIYIKWVDATCHPGEHYFSDEMQVKNILESVGFFLNEDEHIVMITGERCIADEWVRDPHTIPKKMILERRFLS